MGSRGYKQNYGGWETFVDNLVLNWPSKNDILRVYEVTSSKKIKTIIKDRVICPQIYVNPKLGYSRMVLFAIKALFDGIRLVNKDKLKHVVFYILGVRIGPIFYLLRKKLNKLGIKVVINPDGLEWKRSKWNWLVKSYFLLSEKTMIKSSNLVICDSKSIQNYVTSKYKHPLTEYISYGADQKEYSSSFDKRILNYQPGYYLIVARFVPENNFEYIINEFTKSTTQRNLIIISNIENNRYYDYLANNTNLLKDKRIIIFGPLYEQNSLSIMRKNAYCYIHGHSVGGTNPSLLEAMLHTKLIFSYDVNFNREVLTKNGYYFGKTSSLSNLIKDCDNLTNSFITNLHKFNLNRLKENYNWSMVSLKSHLVFNRLFK
jgi:rhamnosyltransferase